MLREREEALGRPLYLISDEPYREITYGIEVPWVPSLYARTIVCYSYSKALSLCPANASDGYTFRIAPTTAMRWRWPWRARDGRSATCARRCCCSAWRPAAWGEPSDVAAYAENRAILTEGLSALGYEYVEPDGAFYLWVRALEEDAQAFSDRAKGIRAAHRSLGQLRRRRLGAAVLLHRPRHHRTLDARVQKL